MTDAATGEDEPADSEAERGEAEWPLRPWLLAGLLGLAGLLVHFATDGHDDDPVRIAIAAFLVFGAIGAAFTLEPGRWKAPSLFAALVGLVMAGLAWRAVRYGESLPDEEYGFAAGAVASALALPLFQAEFHGRRFATPYSEIYGHVWTDAICAAGALAFTGLSWIVLALLSELFHLLQIDFLRDAMEEGWFGWTFSGFAAGAALGTLRNQLKVIATMQTVVLLVASLLAVPLAFGLVVFLLATAVSGPQVLWDATRSATPLLLACAAGSFVLANAIARQDDAAMTRSRVMRGAGLVLAAVILPLAVFAGFSMGLRLDQYGLAPERLWGLVAIVVACVCGVGYWAALARGRNGGWAGYLRKATFHLGLVVCGLAVLLALPIFDFGSISTRNQLARLEGGKVAPDEFDFTALRWDFGEPGLRALERLAKSGNVRIAMNAKDTLAQIARPYFAVGDTETLTVRRENLRFQGPDPYWEQRTRDHFASLEGYCNQPCVAIDLGFEKGGDRIIMMVDNMLVHRFHLEPEVADRAAAIAEGKGDPGAGAPSTEALAPLRKDSIVELRPWTGRQVYVDGKPVGEPFE